MAPARPPVPDPPTSAAIGRTIVSALILAGAVAAGCAAIFAPRLVGTPILPDIAGLPDPGALTRFALPLARTAYDVAAVGVCGTLLLAILLLPRGRADVATPADTAARTAAGAAMRVASRWALSWAGSAVVLLALTLSEVLGRPVQDVLTREIIGEFAYSFGPTRALMSSAFLAVLTAVAARVEPVPATRVLVVVLAVAALVPTLFTGHSGHARYHWLAITSLSVHVLAASVWVGGLLALIVTLRGSGAALRTVLPRFSSVALVCCAGVALSGSVNVWIRLGSLDQLWTTPYGRLALGKIGALVVLAGFGWWHRRRTIAAVGARRPRAFLLLAAVEIAVMLTTVGLAVALSRTPPPPSVSHASAPAAVAPRAGI